MGFKHKFSLMVVAHIRERYFAKGETLEEIADSIKEQTGYAIARQTVHAIATDDNYIATLPKRNK